MMPLPPSRGLRNARTAVVSLVLAAAVSGCASSGFPLPPRPAPGVLSPGSPLQSRSLGDGEAWLRHYLKSGDNEAALNLLRRSAGRPSDRLLRTLQEGVVLHYAGRYQESNRAFEWAEQEADRRYTRSVRRGLGSLLINDRVLAYSPSSAELAIIPYFRMLNYLALGRIESAAVEARKSSLHLARSSERNAEPCGGFGLIHYVAGMVYSAAGERNDALVSLRQAERSFNACVSARTLTPPSAFGLDLFLAAQALGLEDVAESARERYGITPESLPADHGDLVVLLEYGYAAHRAQQDLYVPIFEDDIGGLEDNNAASAIAAAGAITSRVASALLAEPQAQPLWNQSVWNLTFDAQRGAGSLDRRAVAHVLRLAWPVMRLEANRPAAARLLVNGQQVEAPALEDVSARLVRDLEAERLAILSRMVARGLIKYAATQGAEGQAEKKGGELLGRLVGAFTNAAGNALEQADTRTWSLLPDQIAMSRVRLPAGEHELKIELVGTGGAVREVIDLGRVAVRPGETVFLSRRVWGSELGDRERLMHLGIESYRRVPAPAPGDAIADRPRRSSRRTARPTERPTPVIPTIPTGERPTSPPALPPPVRP
jgi:uncharacterized protein